MARTKHDKKHRSVNGVDRARPTSRAGRGTRARRAAVVDEPAPNAVEATPDLEPEVDAALWTEPTDLPAEPLIADDTGALALPDDVDPLESVEAAAPDAETESTFPVGDGEAELAPVEMAEPAGEEDEPEEEIQAARKPGDEPQSFLAMYFRDMAELDVLRPEQEFETARNIETLEIELWKLVLGYAPAAEVMVAVVENAMTKPWAEFAAYRAAADKVAKGAAKAKGKPEKSEKWDKLLEELAPKLRELDIDRLFIDAATGELARLAKVAQGAPTEGTVPAFVHAKGFLAHVRAVNVKVFQVKTAKNAFVKANLRLVVSIARRFNHGRLPLADLIQEGNIGLMKAVERYDYRRGFRFSTYASWWIRHAISRALADKGRAVRLPVHMIDAYHRIAKSERELQSKLDRPATTEEIAQAAGMETEKLEKMRTFLNETPISLDRPISDEDGRRLIDVLADPQETPAAPEQMVTSETHREMLKLLQSLKPIEADILRKRFGLTSDREQTLKEIGDEYHLSRERVRQLQEQALGKMRKAMSKLEA